MPQERAYTGGSIVYFQGDMGDDVFILKQGRVVLITAVETGDELREEVRVGEFFGVKSSLGRYRREETAQVVGKTILISFKPADFEPFLLKNTRLIMKLLKVFSKQLRTIHKQIRDILKVGAARDPAYELMSVAESFYRSGNYPHASYALNKYIEYYPTGRFKKRASELLSLSRKGSPFPMGYPPLDQEPTPTQADFASMENSSSTFDDPFSLPDQSPSVFDDHHDDHPSIRKTLELGMEYMNQDRLQEAYDKFSLCSDLAGSGDADEAELLSKAFFEKGRALVKMRRGNEAAVIFSTYLKKYPTGEYVKGSIFQLGLVAEIGGNKERARSLYHKVATMPPQDEITAEARKRLEKMN